MCAARNESIAEKKYSFHALNRIVDNEIALVKSNALE
jgi:hypothetical protein